MPINLPDVPVDANGQAIHAHRAYWHIARGEMTLCGVYINYDTWKGTAPGAPDCPTCVALDA